MGARRGGARGGHLPSPLEFEKMTSYATVLYNTLKFSLAPSALALDTLYFSLKHREKRQKFSFAPFVCVQKIDLFRRAENVSTFYSVGDFAPL